MGGVLSEGCLDKLASIGVGLGFLVCGGTTAATAIGAGQLVAQGGIGLGAMGAARIIAGRVKEDRTARTVFEKTIKNVRDQLLASGSFDSERLSHVDSQITNFLDRVEFPITELDDIVNASANAKTVHDGLAATMVARLAGPVAADLRRKEDAALAQQLLASAVRAGLTSSQTIQLEIILQFCHRGHQEIVRTRADVASEGAATREVMRAEGAASDARDREMLKLLQMMVSKTEVVAQAETVGISEQAVRDLVETLGGKGLPAAELVPWLEAWIAQTRSEVERLRDAGSMADTPVEETAMRAADAMLRQAGFSEVVGRASASARPLPAQVANKRRVPTPSEVSHRDNSPIRIDVDHSSNLMTRDVLRVRVEGHFSEIEFVGERYIFPVGLKSARVRVDAKGGNVSQASIAGKGRSGEGVAGGLRLTYLFGREWRIEAPDERILHGDPFPEDGLCSIDALEDAVGATVSVVAASSDFVIDRERVRPKGVADVLFFELSSIFDPTSARLVQIYLQEALFKRLDCEGGEALLAQVKLNTRMISDEQ